MPQRSTKVSQSTVTGFINVCAKFWQPFTAFRQSISDLTLAVCVILSLGVLYYYCRRRRFKWLYSDRSHTTLNPFVAQINLAERYGESMKKREVNIHDLSRAQLILLERDGKLSTATVEKLRREGKLPHSSLIHPMQQAPKMGKI